MPVIVYDIVDLIASLIRLLGMAVLGVGIGYLVVDLLHKTQDWRLLMAFFLGLIGLVIAMVVYLSSGALGAFAIGMGVAIFIWGMPKRRAEEQAEEKKEVKKK
jgi:NhaP-type Na+/H+ or K+/H+ antiporter